MLNQFWIREMKIKSNEHIYSGSLFDMSDDEKINLNELKRKENLSPKKISIDDYLEFLQGYNEFINHESRKIGKIKNFKWEL